MQDKVLVLSEAQAVTASAASDNYLDPGVVTNPGNPFMLDVTVDTAFGSGTGSATLTVSIEVGKESTFSTKKTLCSSAAIVYTDLTKGHQLLLPIPHQFTADKDYTYMRAYYTVSAAMNAGALTAVIVPQAFTNY